MLKRENSIVVWNHRIQTFNAKNEQNLSAAKREGLYGKDREHNWRRDRVRGENTVGVRTRSRYLEVISGGDDGVARVVGLVNIWKVYSVGA